MGDLRARIIRDLADAEKARLEWAKFIKIHPSADERPLKPAIFAILLHSAAIGGDCSYHRAFILARKLRDIFGG
jgi:hypothetical protein